MALKESAFRITLLNLYELVSREILTNNSLSLYLFYRLNIGQPVRLKDVTEKLKLSIAAISIHTKLLSILSLVCVQNAGRLTPNVVKEAGELTDKRLSQILADDQLLQRVSELKDARMNKYHPKSVLMTSSVSTHASVYNNNIKSINNNDKSNRIIKKNKGLNNSTNNTRELLDRFPIKNKDEYAKLLDVVLKYLPRDDRSFYITPKYLHKMLRLSKQLDMESYATWFCKIKLPTLKSPFNLGIFLYEGIILEYRKQQRHIERARRRRKTASSGRTFSSSKIRREFGDNDE